MEQHYKLYRVRELADNDQEFILALAQTFLEEVPEDALILEKSVNEKNYLQTYQTAHKLKPTVDMFELGVLDELVEVQDWGKLEQTEKDVQDKLLLVLDAIKRASDEMKQDFNL